MTQFRNSICILGSLLFLSACSNMTSQAEPATQRIATQTVPLEETFDEAHDNVSVVISFLPTNKFGSRSFTLQATRRIETDTPDSRPAPIVLAQGRVSFRKQSLQVDTHLSNGLYFFEVKLYEKEGLVNTWSAEEWILTCSGRSNAMCPGSQVINAGPM